MTDRAPSCDPLLTALVDDAGRFPPTELPMAEALSRHAADARARHPMLTHRFLIRASRIGELWQQSELAGVAAASQDGSLQLGLILDTNPDQWGAAVKAVQDDSRLAVAMVDVPIPEGEDAEPFAAAAAERLDREAPGALVFFEPPRPEWLAVPAGSDAPRGLKVRCGGARADLFPSPGQLAAFIVACAASGTCFKATAGLHEAVRHTDAGTGFTHHGFLNLVIAAVRATAGADLGGVEAALSLTDPDALVAEIRATAADTATAARGLMVSYGSCSTSEPVEAAVRLGLATTGP